MVTSPMHSDVRTAFLGVILRQVMKWIFIVFVVLYGLALLLMAIGTFGWLGQEKDPLAGVFLMPLGLPWTIFGDRLGLSGPMLGLLAPVINAAILLWLWKR